MGRAPCCDKVGLKKGRWTTEEDELLRTYIEANGEGSWRAMPKNAGLLRCGKSCRLRWINYLKDNLKRGNITPQEEELIVKLHSSIGNRWSLIATHLPGRTDNEIKNYWNSHLSRKLHNFRKITPLIINSPAIMDTKKKVLVNNNKTKKKGSREGTKKSRKKNNNNKIIKKSKNIIITNNIIIPEKETTHASVEECSPVSFQEEGIILLNNNIINSSSGEENIIIRNPSNNNNNNKVDDVGGGCEEKLHGDNNNKVLGPYDNDDDEKKYYDINTDEMLSYFDDIILMDIEMVVDPSVAATSSLMTTSASWGEKENDVVFDKKDREIITSSNNNNSSSNSTTPDFEYIGGGIDEWEWESSINYMVPGNQEDVWNINQNNNCNINEDVISWLWNDDDYREEEEIREGEDESKQNAIVAWLLS